MRHRGLLVSFYQEIFRQQFVKYTPCCYHSVFSVSTNVLIWFSPSKSRHYILWRFWFKTISMTWLTKTPFISIFIYQISNDVTLLVWQILPRTIAALLTWRFLEWFFFFFTKITLLSLLHSIRNAFSIPECAPGKRSRPIFWWKILWKCMSASKYVFVMYVCT